MAIPQAGYYQDYARREANRVGIPEDFALALFDAESSWNPQATSPKNARGIAQFIPETGARYGLITDEDFYNPEKSISAGVRHLKDLYDRYEGNLELVAAGYNAGPGAVDKYGGMPPYKETRNYWDRIQQKMGLTQPVNMDGSAALPSDMPMDPGPNQVHPSYGFEPVQREPTMGERLAGDPWLQMGLGILGASGGSGIQNIASGAQQGLANANKSEAAIRQQQSAAMLRNMQRQKLASQLNAGQKPTSAMQNYRFMLQQGHPRTEAFANAFGKAGGTTVNVGQQGAGGMQYGSIPSGHTRTIDSETGAAMDTPNIATKADVEMVADIEYMEEGLRRVKRMRNTIAKHGTEGLPLFSDPTIAGTMQQLRSSLIPYIAVIRNMGVLEQGEREALESSLTDPSSFWSYFRSDKRIDAQYAEVEAEMEAKLKEFKNKRKRGQGASNGDNGNGSGDIDKTDPLGIL